MPAHKLDILRAVEGAVREMSFVMFLKKCIADGLLNIEDKYLYEKGQQSLKHIFLEYLLERLCQLKIQPDLEQLPDNSKLSSDTLYYKIENNKFYYKIFWKLEPSQAEQGDNVDDYAVEAHPQFKGEMAISDLFGSDCPSTHSNAVFLKLFQATPALLRVLLQRNHIQGVDPNLLDIDWARLAGLYDKILELSKKPASFYQRHHYLKFTRQVRGNPELSTSFVFLISNDDIEQYLKLCGFSINTNFFSMFYQNKRNASGFKAGMNSSSRLFRFSCLYERESNHQFLLKFLFAFAAVASGIMALLYIQTALSFSIICTVVSVVSGWSAYRMFARTDLHQRALLGQDLLKAMETLSDEQDSSQELTRYFR
ncbi:MAG: hypothetical protein ACO1N3_02340 [Gammaproteobacteria bacterium]